VAITALITEGVVSTSGQEHWLMTAFPSLPSWAVHFLLGTLITTPIVLFLCEITPKVIGARANQLVAALAVNPLAWLYRLLKPARLALRRLLIFVARQTGVEYPMENAQGHMLREADFMLMLEEGQKEGAIEQNEFELIKNVFEFDDTTVEEITTPLSEVELLSANTTVRAALTALRGHGYSRIPVTGTHRKQIVGILYSKDLLRAKLQSDLMEVPISELMRRPVFVSPSLRLSSLFRKFKHQRNHMGIVQKTNGEAIGIVTMQDVLDTLFTDENEEELA
jgi:putative hemolysin